MSYQLYRIRLRQCNVNSDLQKYNDKWEANAKALLVRISQVERGAQALEKKMGTISGLYGQKPDHSPI